MSNRKQIEIIEKHIIEAEGYLNKEPKEIYDFFTRLNGIYKHIEEIYIRAPSPALTGHYYGTPINYDNYKKYLEMLIDKLKLYMAKLQDEDEKNMSSNQSNSVTINNNNTNTASANIAQDISIKSTIEKIDQIPDEILAKNLKDELKGMLRELEYCKDDQEKKSKLMEVVKWLGDKTADAFIACLQYFAGLGL